MGSRKLLGAVLFIFVFSSIDANTAVTPVATIDKQTPSVKSTTAPPNKDIVAHSTVAHVPLVNPTPSANISTTTHSNQTANSTVTPVPAVNTTTPSANITTTHSNQTTANSTVTPVPAVNTTTPSANITTTTHSNQTTANSTVTPVPAVNTTTPSANITTTTHSNQTANSTVTPVPAVNTTTPSANITTTTHSNQTANTTVTPFVNTTTPSTNTTTTPHSNQTTHPANSTTQPITHTTSVPKPTYPPKPSPPTVGNYSVAGDKGADCIMAVMGLELVIHVKEGGFYNVEPARTKTTGHCAKNTANLNITFNEGFINFNFLSDNTSYFVDHIEVLLTPLNVQQVSRQNLLNTKLGSSFRCKSMVDVNLGKDITLAMINTRLQAFNITHNEFGKESACSADYRTPIAIAVGLTVVIIIILAIIIYFIYRRIKLSGYQRI